MIIITHTSIMDEHKKDNFIVSAHTSEGWVKPVQAAKTLFLTIKLQMGDHAERRRQSRLVYSIKRNSWS